MPSWLIPGLTGPGTLRLSGPLHRKEVPLAPGQPTGSGRAGQGQVRHALAQQGRRGSAWDDWGYLPRNHPRQDQPRKHLDSRRRAHLRPSKQEENGHHMKLWKCDAVGPIDGVLSITVVVMAQTRQQAIEKASAKLSAKLPGVLGQVFGEDDDRRFAQPGPDILDDMEEVPDEVTIVVVGLPVLEPSAGTPHSGLPSA